MVGALLLFESFEVNHMASESLYGCPPNFYSTKWPIFETSSRPYLLKHGAPLATPTSSLDSPLQTRKYTKKYFS